jgi:hypothetical protein
MSRGFLSVHALDGLTNYYPSKDPTKIYARPLNYTFYKSKLADEMTGAETAPAGILQTPKKIHEYKRTVFDFRGTPIVNLVENEWEVKAPPPQINGPSIKNIS